MTHLFKAFPSAVPSSYIASVSSLNLHHAHVHLFSPPCVLWGADPRKVTIVAVMLPRPTITLPRLGTASTPYS